MIFSKASGLNDSIYGKSQDPIRMFLMEREEVYKKGSMIDKIFSVISSDKYAEKFSSFTAKGDFKPVGEAGKYPRTSQQVGYEKVIEPEEWKNSFEVTETMIEDAKMFDVKAQARDFMMSYYRTREKFFANLLLNGRSSTFTFGGKSFDSTCYDGQPLFSTAHPSVTGAIGNQSNLSADTPFSYDNLAEVEDKMLKLTDDDGNDLNLGPDTIIIPNEARIKKLVDDALLTERGKPGTTDNSHNYHYGRWNVLVWSSFKTPAGAAHDPWIVIDSEYAKMFGLFCIDRVPLNVKSWIDHETGNNVFGGRSRWGGGFVDFRCAHGCFAS